MKNELQSHNSAIGATSKHFILPSGSQILLYMLISVLLLISLNLKKIWDYLNHTVLVPQGGLDSVIAQNAPGVHKVLSSLSQSIILQVLFWICVGCVIYIFVWFVKNISINLINDMVADNYVHPTAYKRFKYWESLVARKVFFWVIFVVLTLFIITGLRLLTYLANICYTEILNFKTAHSLIVIPESLLATTGLIYIAVLLIHLAVNSWQLISKDL
jgi:hypothetical protein